MRKQTVLIRGISVVAVPLMVLSALGQAEETERSTLDTIPFQAVEEEQLSETSVIGVPARTVMEGDSPEQLVVPAIYSEEFVREGELERDSLRYFQLLQQEQQNQRQGNLQRQPVPQTPLPPFENRVYNPGSNITPIYPQ